MARQATAPRKQTFRYTAPEAKAVLLVGDFTQWQQNPLSMQKGTNGVWAATVSLPPGKHYYRFIVDNRWCDDPQCTTRVPNPYGSQDMVRLVS